MKQFFAIFQSDYARTVHTAQGETHRRTFLDVRPRHSPASEGQSSEGIIQPTLGMPWDGGTSGLEQLVQERARARCRYQIFRVITLLTESILR